MKWVLPSKIYYGSHIKFLFFSQIYRPADILDWMRFSKFQQVVFEMNFTKSDGICSACINPNEGNFVQIFCGKEAKNQISSSVGVFLSYQIN